MLSTSFPYVKSESSYDLFNILLKDLNGTMSFNKLITVYNNNKFFWYSRFRLLCKMYMQQHPDLNIDVEREVEKFRVSILHWYFFMSYNTVILYFNLILEYLDYVQMFIELKFVHAYCL